MDTSLIPTTATEAIAAALPPPNELAEKLDNLLAELTACDVTSARGIRISDREMATRRVDALNAYLLALRLTVVTGDRNAMFDRLSAGIVACRSSLAEMTNHQVSR